MALTSLHHPIDTPQTLHTIDNWSLHPRKTICTTIRLNNTRKRTFDLRYSKSDVRRRFWNKLIRWGSSVTEWTDEPIAFLDFRLKSFFDCEVKTGVFQLLLMLIILFLWNQTFLFFWFFSFLLLFCCLLFGARRSSSDTHYVPGTLHTVIEYQEPRSTIQLLLFFFFFHSDAEKILRKTS